MLKKIAHQENIEYTYDNEDERLAHIESMESDGWHVGSRSMKLKDGAYILNSTDEDYEWYAEFWRFY